MRIICKRTGRLCTHPELELCCDSIEVREG